MVNNLEIMKMHIPLPCPTCGGRMQLIKINVKNTIKKFKQWHCCKACSFTELVDDFKNRLCTV
jgi:ribosomal protein L33